MKNRILLSLMMLVLGTSWVMAQQPELQYYRKWNKEGINVFEPSKTAEQPEFTGLKVRIGGAFTQGYQSLTHENKAFFVSRPGDTLYKNINLLYGVNKAIDSTSATLGGFNLAMANLNFDIQIEDGIRVCLENYMSARHHNEFWVKGGYIQIDKLPMFGSPDWFTNTFRVKIGHFQPNFGDMQFRRSDGGNTMYNPFGENLILDAFTTEIGSEIYAFPAKGFMIMGGMTSGLINGNILTPVNSFKDANGDPVNNYGVVPTKRSPSVFGKVAYDNDFGKLRFRLSASVYSNPNSTRNTLWAGDRTGSHYFGIMEPATINGLPVSIGTSATGQAGPNFTSGRFDPSVANRVTAICVNPFLKVAGLEIFGGYTIINGANYSDTLAGEWVNRTWSQLNAEALYRFLPDEQMYIGVRYIQAQGEPAGLKYSADDTGKTAGEQANVTIGRTSVAAGWFPSKNLLLRAEYVLQSYTDFPIRDYRNEGKFSGLMIDAVIGF